MEMALALGLTVLAINSVLVYMLGSHLKRIERNMAMSYYAMTLNQKSILDAVRGTESGIAAIDDDGKVVARKPAE